MFSTISNVVQLFTKATVVTVQNLLELFSVVTVHIHVSYSGKAGELKRRDELVLREPTRPKWWGTAGAPRDSETR